MSLLSRFSHLVVDPPPSVILEFSDAGIAYARNGEAGFAVIEPGTIVVSPLRDNILRTDAVSSTISRIVPAPADTKKRTPAVVILPDYAARVSVLDFDSFPASPEEQLALVRFRLKKSLPYDVDSAAVSYFVQTDLKAPRSGKIEVIAVAVALDVIARYEALCRSANLHPGKITTSALAALQLFHGDGAAVIAKLNNRVLTVMAVLDRRLRLFRCVELEDATEAEVLSVLQPTMAYVEDELGARSSRLVLCGFTDDALKELTPSREPLRSRAGQIHAFNAGLMGYLEGALN